MFSSSVSCVAVSAVALLMAHSELVFKLWRSEPTALAGNIDFAQARASHNECAAVLRRQCLRELSRTEHASLM